MNMMYGNMGLGLPLMFGSTILILMAWSIVWKGLALWRAAKRGDTWWFVALMILNTAGILEIIYLFAITGAKISDFTDPLSTHSEKKDDAQK